MSKVRYERMDELSELYFQDVWLLEDGRVIISYDNFGFIHESKISARNFFLHTESVCSQSMVVNRYSQVIGDPEVFFKKIDSLTSSIISFIPNDTLFLLSVPKLSLANIDQFINSGIVDVTDPEFLQSLIVYIGNYINEELNGSWILINNPLIGEKELVIRLGQDEYIDPLAIVVKEIYEYLPIEKKVTFEEYVEELISLHRSKRN